ncbi:accessory Sec system translocase SecA2 [Dietzia sp.]|uniref:accessory Sec system translocase SecA2 n=1 Tax=Dietzia sp. TaxID=1871616 RepID=UPI002FD94771
MKTGLWKILGASQKKDTKKAKSSIDASAEFESWAAGLPTESFADEAHALDLFGDPAPDEPKFLALVREAAERSVGLRPFDVQLQGALRMFAGDVVEMATGEGKTLSGAIAAAGYALQGHTVHLMSVNDYLARRDAKWMGPLFEILGLSVGYVTEHSTREERKAAYSADVTYGSVSEIGFDILREQTITRPGDLIRPITDVVIVDEADSVLVDEALVPLVLAGSTSAEAPSGEVFAAVRRLRAGRHYETDAERRNIFLTEDGARAIENELHIADLYDAEHVGTTLVQVNVALHANVLLRRDVDYIVRDGRVQLINSSRGRVAELQRWPDGLQAAVEVKEGVAISEAGKILDSMTVQALIGRYKRVSGMTGTALAAGNQFREFYSLGVSLIEQNRPNIRVDEPDEVFIDTEHKNAAIVQKIAEVHATAQPILIGTQDVAESERLAEALAAEGVEAMVLNAKNDAEEAEIIAEAGNVGNVTVSTQMAGRGTDIKLGGSDEARHDEVAELGGLFVIGTGRHRTERLDNQLRGRAGRQGDPGRSLFFSSMEDDVIASAVEPHKLPTAHDKLTGEMRGEKPRHLVDHAQRVADGQMLEIHANTWRYSKLLAEQRDIIAERRRELLLTEKAYEEMSEHEPDRIAELEEKVGHEATVQGCRDVMLWHLDHEWAEHLEEMEDVRESIHLRALGRQNPLDEFHRIAIAGFKHLANRAVDEARVTLAGVAFTDAGADLESEGKVRPTSTWTYMVHDNPMAAGGNVFSGMMGAFR